MKQRIKLRLFIFCVVLFVHGTAQNALPKLEQRVTDFTNSLSYTEWSFLETRLKSFEDTTSTQVAMLFINTLNGESIEEYANKVFEQNKIGQKNKNNGALVVVVKDERLVRIEVGYGLEGSLTDAVCSRIIEKEMKPMFREGHYFAGLSNAASAMIAAIGGEYSADGKGRQAPMIAVLLFFAFSVFFFVFLLPMIFSRRRTEVRGSGWKYYPGWGYSSRSGGSFFKGFGGGGGGGWSGGGGMSGGGGATGKW